MKRRVETSIRRATLLRACAVLGVALALYGALNLLVFRTPLYRTILDPDSGTGTFERAIATLNRRPADPSRDILVLGDSRIYDGLVPEIASAAAGHRFRFVRAAVPGTTPRCWRFFDAAIDPAAKRFRAVVIPVDTLGDDDSAIGSIDANNREDDLRFLVYRLNPREFAAVTGSFDAGIVRTLAVSDLLLAGPLLRDDLRDLLADPARRASALAAAAPFDLTSDHASAATPLIGLRADFAGDSLEIPSGVGPDERTELERQILPQPHFSAAYAAYRMQWIGPLVRAYLAAGRPVIFVRIPTRPLHRPGLERPSGTLLAFTHLGARVLDPAPYLALERPAYFGDHDHMNAEGATRFSDELGRDVAAAIARGE